MDAWGKVFIVTGAGNGIGRQVALELARRGAVVAGADLSEAGLAKTASLVAERTRFTGHLLNVSDREAVAAFPAEVLAAHGRIDGLFSIAGVAQEFARAEDVSDERMEALFRVNFFGSAWLTRAVLPHLKARPEAAIMLMSSLSAIVPMPGTAVYGATKAAVLAFADGLRQDVRTGCRVTVTAAIPGSVWTDIVRTSASTLGVSEKVAKSFATMPEVAARRIVDATLRGRSRAIIGADAHVYQAIGRVSSRLAGRLAYAQTGRFLYRSSVADRAASRP